MKSKIAQQFTFPTCFSFYVLLLDDMRNGRPLRYHKIHSAGGRGSGKTYCFTLFALLCFYYRLPVIIYAFRKQQNEVGKSVWEEFLARFQNTNIPHKVNKSQLTITNGKTKIVCSGLYNPMGKKVVLKGLAGSSNYTYAIKWFEEAIDYLDSDINAVNQAVRGAKYLMEVFTTNPWHAANPYISYLNTSFPFNQVPLLGEGFQWKVIGKELFHYTNYRVNPSVTPQYIETLESMKFQDENEWKIISIGLPGVPSGGVYANLLKHISRLTQPGDIYSCGIDFGFVHDPMAIVLVSTQNKVWNTVDVLAELYFKNQSRYTWHQLAYVIVRWLNTQAVIRPMLRTNGLNVYCDKSNLTFIEVLNRESQKQSYDSWLKFFSVPQYEVLARISFKQGLIGANKMNISLTTNYLLQELAICAWDKKTAGTKPKLLRDIPDHAIDAFDYAMTPWYRTFLQQINPNWFRKQSVGIPTNLTSKEMRRVIF